MANPGEQPPLAACPSRRLPGSLKFMVGGPGRRDWSAVEPPGGPAPVPASLRGLDLSAEQDALVREYFDTGWIRHFPFDLLFLLTLGLVNRIDADDSSMSRS